MFYALEKNIFWPYNQHSKRVSTHLWGFFFFIIFAETPACSEEKKMKPKQIHQTLQTNYNLFYDKMVMAVCVPRKPRAQRRNSNKLDAVHLIICMEVMWFKM